CALPICQQRSSGGNADSEKRRPTDGSVCEPPAGRSRIERFQWDSAIAHACNLKPQFLDDPLKLLLGRNAAEEAHVGAAPPPADQLFERVDLLADGRNRPASP